MAGVSNSGFTPKTIEDLTTQLNGVWRTVFGAAVNVDPRSRNGQIIAAAAGVLAEGWNLGAALFNVFAQPSGVLLDYVSALTGTLRNPATASTATLTLTGTTGTVIPAGKVASVQGMTAQFATNGSSTLAAVSAWTATTVMAVGNRRKNSGNVYQVISVTGDAKTAGAGGPSGTGSAIVDNHVTWMFLGAGDGSFDAAATCTATGPVQGYAGTITVISTPVAGWQGVNNVLDAAPGSNVETDPQLRTRRSTEAAGQGRSPLDAIRARLFKVAGVTQVFVFENTTDGTVNGMSPHTIECLVTGGTDADVAQGIFGNKAGGPGTSGSSSQTVNDSEGTGHVINFSRPSEIDIFETITVAVDVTAFPADGKAQAQDALVAAGNALGQGRDVYARAVEAALFAKDSDGNLLIPGVLDVQSHFVGTAINPVTTTVSITQRQFSKWDTSRTTVTIVPGTP